MKKLFHRFRRWIARRWECATKRCSYYECYLVYGPAELTHIGYHNAERHCLEAQRRLSDWFDAHPTGEPPAPLTAYVGRWEERIRA